MPLLYLASNNPHKAEEIRAVLGTGAWEIRLASELKADIDWEENGATFAANAKIKAETVRAYTDAAVLADDSGLAVDALNGEPGIYSSRYAGLGASDGDNRAKLIKAISAVPVEALGARFVCALYFIAADGRGQSYCGECRGRLVREERGAHGFGYDALFIPEGMTKTLAELTPAEKNTISHRRKALDLWRRSLPGD